jgi:hypothetical protein
MVFVQPAVVTAVENIKKEFHSSWSHTGFYQPKWFRPMRGSEEDKMYPLLASMRNIMFVFQDFAEKMTLHELQAVAEVVCAKSPKHDAKYWRTAHTTPVDNYAGWLKGCRTAKKEGFAARFYAVYRDHGLIRNGWLDPFSLSPEDSERVSFEVLRVTTDGRNVKVYVVYEAKPNGRCFSAEVELIE